MNVTTEILSFLENQKTIQYLTFNLIKLFKTNLLRSLAFRTNVNGTRANKLIRIVTKKIYYEIGIFNQRCRVSN